MKEFKKESEKETVIIAKLVKKGSPDHVLFNVDPLDTGDNWFINCKKVTNKTNTVKDYSLLTRKDLYSWMRYYTGTLGWTIDSIHNDYVKYVDTTGKKTEKVA